MPRPPLLSHFSWEPRAALSYWRELAARRRLQHARTRAGLRGSYPRPREEGETGTHRGEEEEDKEGGRKPARRTGAGGGRLATFSPPASAQGKREPPAGPGEGGVGGAARPGSAPGRARVGWEAGLWVALLHGDHEFLKMACKVLQYVELSSNSQEENLTATFP